MNDRIRDVKLSPQTTSLLQALQNHSGDSLRLPDELGMLFELARSSNRWHTIEELSFHAKFVHKAYGILNRIGPDADGYDTISAELGENVTLCTALIRTVLEAADAENKRQFERRFLEMHPEAFRNLLLLFHDLHWLKNYSIDTQRQQNP